MLGTFRDTGSPWVAGPRVEKTVADAFQRAMIEVTDARLLEELPASPERYVAATDDDYNEFRFRVPEAESFDKPAELSKKSVAETRDSP